MPPTASWCFISFFFFFLFFYLFFILFFFNGIHLNKMLKNENKKAYETRGKMEHFVLFFVFFLALWDEFQVLCTIAFSLGMQTFK